ncbi:MAG: two pore domain potassium channel family protein [Oligoflexia bacterium]|nr:two pore domain potassium channel family protein [Oligoflexia bacterium]
MQFSIDFGQAFLILFWEGLPFFTFLSMPILIMGQIVGRIEKWTPFDSFYWSVITATTVGYGDFRPQKGISKLLSLGIIGSGIVITGFIVMLSVRSATMVTEIKYGAKDRQNRLLEKVESVIR